jgi:tRNA threonylcarbamoyladenosine biosynthesis protein TsaE
MNYVLKSVEDLSELAEKLITDIDEAKVIVFNGEMGVGKTTLIKHISTLLGVNEITSSPTFSIVNEYISRDEETIYHFDFYRIEKEEEVLDLGYEDYFYSGNYCFIEWAEKIPNLLPENIVEINIELDEENNRLISVVR